MYTQLAVINSQRLRIRQIEWVDSPQGFNKRVFGIFYAAPDEPFLLFCNPQGGGIAQIATTLQESYCMSDQWELIPESQLNMCLWVSE